MAFRKNPGFEADLRKQPAFHEGMTGAAKAVARFAEQFAKAAGAPWMPKKGSGTGRIFRVEGRGGEVRVVNPHHDGHLVESGSKNNPPHAPLRRGVRAAGLRLDEKPK